jgi:hypothetical protein
MGSFLRRLDLKKRVVIEVPMAIPTDAQFDIRVTNEAYENTMVTIRQDDEVVLTIDRDGSIKSVGDWD